MAKGGTVSHGLPRQLEGQRRHDGSKGKTGRNTIREGIGMQRKPKTYLAHFGSNMDVPLNTQENRAVMSQKDTLLLPTTAPHVGRMISNHPALHGVLVRFGFIRGVCHSYCGGRRDLVFWGCKVDRGDSIVAMRLSGCSVKII